MLPGLLKGLEHKMEQPRDNIFELKKCFSNIMRDKIGTASSSREETFYILSYLSWFKKFIANKRDIFGLFIFLFELKLLAEWIIRFGILRRVQPQLYQNLKGLDFVRSFFSLPCS